MTFVDGALDNMSDEEKNNLFEMLKKDGVAPFCYEYDDDGNCTNYKSEHILDHSIQHDDNGCYLILPAWL